ncbi:MAG TPA: AAA family ATPase [Patescibacteria group bacterium]|nr:AAA family ATPase [Patescibacteria group bacterium]
MSRLGPLVCPILVGRDPLLELADRRLADAADGRGHFLLLAGEAGIGKSRLLGAIGRSAANRGFRVATSLLAPQDRELPAACVLDLARSMQRRPEQADLGRALLDLRDQAVLAAERPRRRVLVLTVVDAIVATLDKPTALIFEDLQWADELSLEILGALAREVGGRPILIVGTYRSDEVRPGAALREWRSRLVTQRLADEVRLAPLTLDETALMTTLILDNGLPAPREVAAAVHQRTDGIPLHIEELLGAISDAGRLDQDAILGANVPETIEDAILERMAHRSAEARAVARAGAVIGRSFVPQVLAGIMNCTAEDLDSPLQELVEHGFLNPPGERGSFDYRHQLVRDTLYQSVPAADRRRLHAGAAEFGAQLEGASDAHASLHFEKAGLALQAHRAALAGARQAARLSSHREAMELYQRALHNAPPDLDPGRLGELFEALSEEATANDNSVLVEHYASQARDRFSAAGRPINAVRAGLTIAWCWRRVGRPVAERIELLMSLLAEIDRLERSVDGDRIRAELLGALAYMQLDALAIADVGLTAAQPRPGEDVATAVAVRSLLGARAALSGDVEHGLAEMGEAVRSVRDRALTDGSFVDVALTSYRDLAATAARVMEYRLSATWAEEGIAFTGMIEQVHCRYNMFATQGLLAWADGRWDDAVATASQVLADQRGGVAAATMARAVIGYVTVGRGDFARARSILDEGLARGSATGEVARILPSLWGLAEVERLGGRDQAAADRCEEALAIGIETGERALIVPFLVTGVRAYLAANEPERAESFATRLESFLADTPVLARASTDHARGLIRLAAGSTASARDGLEAAVRGWDDVGRIWEATWARLDLARCLARTHRGGDALALVADVRTTALRLDSAPLRDRADELAGLVRGRGSLEEPWRPLTAREFEVARLIAEGMTNAEIAGELAIAPRTAGAHVEHILAKLGVTRRAEIATWVATVARPPSGTVGPAMTASRP